MLCRWPLVGLDRQSGIRRLIERRLRTSKQMLRFVPGTGSGGWPAAKEYARAGIGPALLPLATLDADDSRDLVVRRLSDSLAIQDYLLHRPRKLNTAQKRLKQSLHAAAEHQQSELRRRRFSATTRHQTG